MAFNRNTQTAKQSETKKDDGEPTYFNALVARSGKDEKVFWTKIGAAFPAKDGEGWNLVLDALPIDGRVFLRAPSDKSDA
ncbi:hypothetical protein KHC28_01380 [Ancylobacter sonchi]|uniref:hypothetical protein n=1 Tax=Ancylobacter sonchi TaxID=1937790 RepID=UPI001BD68A6F|nr:hypothetical protein [Ancylobacter sonchi]MBS7532304.1 hypothetical protein [Ancylobacter sonchi]